MAACRHCGSELPEAARFCPSCGVSVAAHRGEERKVVTVLFADLADSTAQADGRDPEDVRAAVRPQVTRMREELERFGGTFEKYVGDAVMAVFGAPVAHEDDPERAVRAALAIRDALPGVRVAVATGRRSSRSRATPGNRRGNRDRRRRQHGVPNRGGGRARHRARRREHVPRNGVRDRVRPAASAAGAREAEPGRGLRGAERTVGLPRVVRRAGPRAADRPEGGAAADHRHDRAGPARPDRAARDARRGAGNRQEPPGLGAPARGRGTSRGSSRGDGGAASPTATASPSGRSARWSRRKRASSRAIRPTRPRRSSGARSRDLVADRRQATWVENHLRRLITLEARRASEARTPSPRGAASSSPRRVGPSSLPSRTCTGPTPACSTSSTTSPTGRRACRSSSSARRDRSCSSVARAGALGRTRRRSRYRR